LGGVYHELVQSDKQFVRASIRFFMRNGIRVVHNG